MPESFDGMLAELADAAASATSLPDIAAVRARARERTVHRRLGAGALALGVLAAAGGTVAAVSASHQPAASVAPLGTPGGAVPTPSPVASGGASPSQSTTRATTGTYAAIAGVWQPSSGGRELVVFSDGVIGIGQSGGWALCDGRLKALGDGSLFYVAQIACSDYGAGGLVLRVQAGSQALTMSVPASAKIPAYTLVYRRTDGAPALATAAADLDIKQLVGLWDSGSGDSRSIDMSGAGIGKFNGVDDTGAPVTFVGRITAYYADAVRIEIPCVKPVDGLGYCGVIELQYDAKGVVTAVGSYGTETFVPQGSLLFDSNPSDTAVATRVAGGSATLAAGSAAETAAMAAKRKAAGLATASAESASP